MLLHEIWNAPSAKLFTDFAEVKPSLDPEDIIRIQAWLDRYEQALEHDNNELAADLYDKARHFLDARLVANASTEDTEAEEYTFDNETESAMF